MKNIIVILILVSFSFAQELSANLGLYSKYIWRGYVLYDGFSIQPSVAGRYDLGEAGSINGEVWSHFSAEGKDDFGLDFTEIDYMASYTLPIESLSLSIGHLWYTFPKGKNKDFLIDNSNEFFLEVALEEAPLSPKFTFYKDYDLFKNEYYDLNLSHTLKSDSLNIAPSVNFGFASNAEKVYIDDGLIEITLGLALPFETESVSLTPNVNYTFGIVDETTDEFWAGVDVGVAF